VTDPPLSPPAATAPEAPTAQPHSTAQPPDTAPPDPAAVLRARLDAGLRNLALCIAYDGGPFMGWQVQPHGPTVQGRLEEALRVLTRRPTTLYGSGRTDAGVHAYNQVANAWLPAGQDLGKLRAGLNGLAGPDISVKALAWADPEFHARHSAQGKCYRYLVFNRPYPPLFERTRCWWVRPPLDVEAMRAAAARLLGEHDFSAFRAKDCAAASPVRRMRAITLSLAGPPEEALRVDLEASGFLQHMARIVVGTLVAVGLGKLTADDVAAILAGRRREGAAATAPPQGLHLLRVDYDQKRFPELRALLADDPAAGTP